jgi:hypothetical protein
MGSPATRPTVTAPIDARHARSKVTNGSRLFADMTVDGRSGWSRRLRDLLQLHVADLGGEDVVSAAEHSICRRIAAITTELELLERRFALKGKGASEKDLDLYFRGAGVLRAGPGCLNRFSASISGVSAGIRPPSGVAAE